MSEVSTGAIVEKANYTHEAMIDCIIQNPSITQGELAQHFGYTEGWVSQILRSDALRELLAARKLELFDPVVLQGLEKRMEALAHHSIEILAERLQINRSADTALKVLEVTSRGLGYGAKQVGVQINQQFVVAMPQKAENGEEWITQHKPRLPIGISLDTAIDVPLVQ